MKSHAAEMVRAYLDECKGPSGESTVQLITCTGYGGNLQRDVTKDVAQLLKDFDDVNADLASANRVQTSMQNVMRGSKKPQPSNLKIKGQS